MAKKNKLGFDEAGNEFPETPASVLAHARGDMANALRARMPGGIEAQEKAGQDDLVKHCNRLPVDGTIGGRKDNREIWEKLGFKFGKQLSGQDKIFVECTFPKGWKLEGTGHSMWNNILDDKGRVRAMFFFKAAFYDYNAHIGLPSCRYIAKLNYSEDKSDHYAKVVIMDTVGEKVIEEINTFKTREEYMTALRDNKEMAGAYERLDELFPNANDPMAYWD